jgi:alkanesulfonate monooxygenase SsuD/methylene tetrahydromethanopterin reductase-like flavin-dependent oxidoreductase (luciferase family)
MTERLGYGSYWVAEHHFHHYGIVPAPAVLLSATAQRTQTLRVGTGVVVCPFLATSKGQKFEDLYDRRLLIIGDLAYCREHIAELRDWGMIRMLALSNFGGLVHDQVGKSMQLFADEVIPAFARRGVSVT